MIGAITIYNLKCYLKRAFLLEAAVILGAAVVTIFWGLFMGLQGVVGGEEESLRLTVRPDAPVMWVGVIPDKVVRFSREEVEEINQMEGVSEVYEEVMLKRWTTMSINLPEFGNFGGRFDIDVIVFGASEGLFEELDLEGFEYREGEVVPVVISKGVLDIYNFLFAEQTHLPVLGEDKFLGREFDLYLDYSSLFKQGERGEPIRCRIVGFSDWANLTGLTVPMGAVENWSHEGNFYPQVLYVEAEDNLVLEEVKIKLEEKGYRVEVSREWESAQRMSWYVGLFLGVLGVVVWVAVVLSLVIMFTAVARERRREVGMLRIVGARGGQVRGMFYLEAVILGLVGGVVGVGVGYGIGKGLEYFLRKRLEVFSFGEEVAFDLTWWMMLLIIFGTVAVVWFSIWGVARKMSRKEIFNLVNDV